MSLRQGVLSAANMDALGGRSLLGMYCAGNRSVDVYVRRLRVKLERALPGWRFIHTHFGFGYRLAPERSRGSDTSFTAR